MPDLIEIEKLTRSYADSREALGRLVRNLEDEMQSIKRRHLPGIKRSVASVAEKHQSLKTALEDGKGFFRKPKTMIIHGIKIGFQKAKGKISWADDGLVVKLIKKHFSEQADILIKTTEKPSRDALLGLSAADLKRIGCTVEDSGDVVVIKSTDSEIEKLVDKLLKEKDEAVGDEEALA